MTKYPDNRPGWFFTRERSIAEARAENYERRNMTIEERLARDRIIFLAGEVNDASAYYVVSYLFHLEAADPEADIYLYINSYGGSVSAGFAIYDAMEYIRCDVVTVCLGTAASMGAFLLACGAPSKRISLPHSTIMLHQPLYGYQGQVTDMEIHVKHGIRIKDTLNRILTEKTRQPLETIRRDTDRDFFLTAQEAKEYGLIDQVAGKRPE